MYGLNIDPNNPRGNPDPAELRELGVEMVRYTYHDPTGGDQLDVGKAGFFSQRVRSYREAGIGSLLILTYDTYPNRPDPAAPDAEWDTYIERFARRAGQIANLLGPWQPALQVWNEPDHPVHPGYVPTLREAVFGRMLRRTHAAIKNVNPNLKVVAGGLAAGNPDWLTKVIQSLGGELPADIVAFHPYGQRPDPDWPRPDWGFGSLSTLLNDYYKAGKNKPLWVTEMGVKEDDLSNNREQVAEFLRRYYRAITTRHSNQVQQLFWFCYSDGMVPTFGLRDSANNRKPAYQAYREVVSAGLPSTPAEPPPTPPSEPEPLPPTTLARFRYFAQYLEQNIIFGASDNLIQREMETELKGVRLKLFTEQIRQITEQMLLGSAFTVSPSEIESLFALQNEKDLYGLLRAIVLATHQRTGALSGRLGFHTRISAETEANASTNVAAVVRALSYVQPGNRLVITDMVKANGDESKLRGPDVFEANAYAQHRNGLVDNHAWNLQKLVRAIRDRGYQDRALLIIRLDGPDGGANVNVFNTVSLQKYELAILKFIRYLETVLPATPFKLILGNEPDLPSERLWSDPHVEPRAFTFNQFAPAMGTFMKRMARQRPDVTFLCPALSANLKRDYMSYYLALFGTERPENLIPCMHGYAGDVVALPGEQKNLLEQQAEALRTLAQFRFVSGTEIGSGNPLGDCDSLSDKGRFADVVAWVMLSVDHRTPPGQDNNWSFRINPTIDDPAARRFGEVVNRTQARVLRNIRAQGGAGLPLMRNFPADRPAYAVQYVSHNTPPLMVAGQTNAVQLTIRNTSYRTWAAGGANAIRVGYRWYTADGREVATSLWAALRTDLPYSLPPDQSVTLNCQLGAPRVADSYEVRWDIVEEMRTWFSWQGAPTLNVPITVKLEGDAPPPQPVGLSLSASHNNRQQGEDNLTQALDKNPYTRWSSRQPQQAGMWFQIDLGEARPVGHLRLDNELSPRDFPRSYAVKLSTDGQTWVKVAENPLNDRPLDVAFSPQQTRFIRVELTGDDAAWWSIHEVEISAEVLMSVSASHNNVVVGEDNLRQAFDGRPETRWSSQALQQPGMWF
ncbi:MAG: discoidin domain-containing protein [Anaerolineae bacterium]